MSDEDPLYASNIKDFFLDNVYGRLPCFEDVNVSYVPLKETNDPIKGTLSREIEVRLERKGLSASFPFLLLLPNNPKGVFVFICNRKANDKEESKLPDAATSFFPGESIASRGYGAASFLTEEIAEDKKGFRHGLNRLFPDISHKEGNSYGTLALWAKGVSLLIDYLREDSATSSLPLASLGHSRGGKASLLAGVLDQRIDLAIASCAGKGGDAEESNLHEGAETIKLITRRFPYWFAPNYKRYGKIRMPFRQSEFLSLLCPRLLYTSSKSLDLWADPISEYETLLEVSESYEERGANGLYAKGNFEIGREMISLEGNIGHHHLHGAHSLNELDWRLYMDFWDCKLRKK
jgi:hypothetical protein